MTTPTPRLVPDQLTPEMFRAAEAAGVSFATQQKCWAAWFAAAPPAEAPAERGAHVDALREFLNTGDVSDWQTMEAALRVAITLMAAAPAAPATDDENVSAINGYADVLDRMAMGQTYEATP